MTLLQLEYFQALANVLHYTRTAEKLHISQPTLSYAITELEKELGGELFTKKNKQVALTVYGQQFLPYVEKSLALLQDGKVVLGQLSGRTEQIVRLGYFHSVSASLIPSIVEGFYSEEDDSRVKFHFAEETSYAILHKLQRGELDLGICLHHAEWTNSIAILRQPLYLAVPRAHRLAGRQFVTFRDFAGEPQIMLERGSNLRANMDQLFSIHGVIPNIVFEVRECNAALQYVGLGFGVSVLPYVPAMESDKLSVITIADHDEQFIRTVYLTYNKTKPVSPAAQKIINYIIDNFAL